MSLIAFQQKVEERPEGATGIESYLQKLLNAAKQAIAEREPLNEENQELTKQNNEKKTRQHVKEREIGDARVMSYEDIVEALEMRDRSDANKEKKEASRKATNKVSKPRTTKTKCTVDSETEAALWEVEAAGLSTYCSILAPQPDTNASDQAVKVPHCHESTNMADIPNRYMWSVEGPDEIMPWQAPVARMY
ncbi:hypothetical protein BDY21DRAFT_286344 [Lineolata rhizophorae]|uniref:Uncharacterized protein n=1 Tax=Lineolata rhizophorae TaxID=578093 RepID=A0A6A6NZW2_9PEZI|nr:hypothetical protein BDY21DRAFT_286344 [Lineolata rhizophorae]